MHTMMRQVLLFVMCMLFSSCFACSSTRVVFLKFHKTGSESTLHYLRNTHLFDQFAKYWNIKLCQGGNFGHPTLMTFEQRGVEGIRSTCLLATPTDGCRTEHVYITTVLREPLERLSSHMFYFKSLWQSRLRTMPAGKPALAIYNQLHTKPANITVAQMTTLVKTMTKAIPRTPKYNMPTSMVTPYSLVLGRAAKPPYLATPEVVTAAKQALQSDLNSVGIMEDMEAYFYLLSRDLNIDASLACNMHITHEAEMRQPSVLQRSRPTADKLFAPEVVVYMRELLAGETEIYNLAKERHVQHLAAINHTVTSAKAEFQRICGQADESQIEK